MTFATPPLNTTQVILPQTPQQSDLTNEQVVSTNPAPSADSMDLLSQSQIMGRAQPPAPMVPEIDIRIKELGLTERSVKANFHTPSYLNELARKNYTTYLSDPSKNKAALDEAIQNWWNNAVERPGVIFNLDASDVAIKQLINLYKDKQAFIPWETPEDKKNLTWLYRTPLELFQHLSKIKDIDHWQLLVQAFESHINFPTIFNGTMEQKRLICEGAALYRILMNHEAGKDASFKKTLIEKSQELFNKLSAFPGHLYDADLLKAHFHLRMNIENDEFLKYLKQNNNLFRHRLFNDAVKQDEFLTREQKESTLEGAPVTLAGIQALEMISNWLKDPTFFQTQMSSSFTSDIATFFMQLNTELIAHFREQSSAEINLFQYRYFLDALQSQLDYLTLTEKDQSKIDMLIHAGNQILLAQKLLYKANPMEEKDMGFKERYPFLFHVVESYKSDNYTPFKNFVTEKNLDTLYTELYMKPKKSKASRSSEITTRDETIKYNIGIMEKINKQFLTHTINEREEALKKQMDAILANMRSLSNNHYKNI